MILLGSLISSGVPAQIIQPICSFNGTNGSLPQAPLTLGPDGLLYGTTAEGGSASEGTVFQVSTSGTLTKLVDFTGPNGAYPEAALTLGLDGNFYGLTSAGGTSNLGTVFRMTTGGALTTIYDFTGAGGDHPEGGLLLEPDGELIGTTANGGLNDGGEIFAIPSHGGFETAPSFDGLNGLNPQYPMVLGQDGNIYGTTASGGTASNGVVFQYGSNGLVALINFNGANGSNPSSALTMVADGTFFGVTAEGGTSNAGVVFHATTNGTLISESPLQTIGAEDPFDGGLIQGPDGSLYSTTTFGGVGNMGTLYRMTPGGTLTLLENFNGTNGANPSSGLTYGPDGNLYGLTSSGGSFNKGVVYRVVLPPLTSANNYLTVFIAPGNAISSGAMWQLNRGPLQSSGATLSNLLAGTYEISFSSAEGWMPPTNQFVTLSNDNLTTLSVVYTNATESTNAVVLVTNGSGTIKHPAWPKVLVTGKKYSVTAAPVAGNSFVNWVGGTNPPYSLLGTAPTLTFTNEPNLVLQANFVTNEFLFAGGSYYGLFAPQDSDRSQTNSGYFSLNITPAGAMSGALRLGPKTIPLSGKLAVGANLVLTNKIAGQNPLVTALELNSTHGTVEGTVSDGSFYSTLIGYRAIFGPHNNATEYEGKYTLVIDGTTNSAEGPLGSSWGTVTISPTGALAFAGSLADGTAVSQSSAILTNGWWPLYLNLYGGKGSLWGWNQSANGTMCANPGLSWINGGNASKTAALTGGFTNQSATLTGGPFNPNVQPPTGFSSAQVSVTNAEWGKGFTNAIGITPAGAVADLGGGISRLTLSINKSTGMISGSFANPFSLPQTIKCNGVILQGQTNARGYFIVNGASGALLMESQ